MVKYTEFPEEQDKEFHAANYETHDKIVDQRKRFRPLLEQLESNWSDCKRVQVGTRVCAINDYGVE
jgi:SAWADEE domain